MCLFEDYYRTFLKGFCYSFSKTVEENTIPAGAGGSWGPPPLEVLVWGCSNFLTFLNNTCSSHEAQSGAFIPTAWVLSHTALNALFYLYPTKSIFRPTSGHWILTFYSSLEDFEQMEADCTIFANKLCTVFFAQMMPLKRICPFSVFFE